MVSRTLKTLTLSGLFGAAFLVAAGQAEAAADLSVSLQGPAAPQIYALENYNVTISNIGNKDVASSSLRIDLPLTTTSPQVYILGALGQIDSRCQLVNRGLTCALGSIRKQRSVALSFQFKFPQSSRALSLVATVSTSAAQNSTGNDRSTLVPSLNHPELEISGDMVVSNSHCTGTNLSAYFECLTAPSSIAGHDANFHANGTISFDGAPEYTGVWSQPNSTKELAFEYYENGEKVAAFSGWAVDANCFEGVTNFFPVSAYVSPYRVCLPQ